MSRSSPEQRRLQWNSLPDSSRERRHLQWNSLPDSSRERRLPRWSSPPDRNNSRERRHPQRNSPPSRNNSPVLRHPQRSSLRRNSCPSREARSYDARLHFRGKDINVKRLAFLQAAFHNRFLLIGGK